MKYNKLFCSNFVRIVTFSTILIFAITYINSILRFKYRDGISSLSTFYELENNTVDVLILGSSHAYVNFNNGVLWNEYGIASFNLGGSIQPMWNTYHYLLEAYKTQSPELIVLDAYSLSIDQEYSDDARIIKNTYGLKWSINKVEAILDSVSSDKLDDFVLEYRRYHTRYSSLNRGDFCGKDDIQVDTSGKTHYKNWKGQDLMNISVPQIEPKIQQVVDKGLIPEKQEYYYRKILELANERDTPVMVVVTPYTIGENAQTIYNSAADIAEEYGARFINFNLQIEELGLDFQTDYADSEHMNIMGSEKFSHYFGRLICNQYSISNRKGNEKYISWQENSEYTEEYRLNYNLIQIRDLAELASALENENYVLIVSSDGQYSDSKNKIGAFLEKMHITDAIEIIGIEEKMNNSFEGSKDIAFEIDDHDILIRGYKECQDVISHENCIMVDGISKGIVENGINIIVYDRIMKTVVDCIGIDGNDYSITHMEEMNIW